ncbi:hypothetical protein BV25DRAFT_1921874 [Artomyces pyxidatus]|uniref:Uncharacterized protein n=1 Tax=Artomyces pyxidatus TaxID=48021 RepID=A0ACB8SFR2_9AGAM|nr:hypothetical protein BV25DRAFT_1921874 [Artomyces pyxidatus]
MSSTADAPPHSTMIMLPTSHEPRVDIPVWSLAPPWSNATPAVLAKPITFPVRRFFPPSLTDTPTSLFLPVRTRFGSRYMRLTDPREILIYADGTCVAKKTSAARAGPSSLSEISSSRFPWSSSRQTENMYGPRRPTRPCFHIQQTGRWPVLMLRAGRAQYISSSAFPAMDAASLPRIIPDSRTDASLAAPREPAEPFHAIAPCPIHVLDLPAH